MDRQLKMCRIVLALAVILTGSSVNAEEPRGVQGRVESSREAREALVASIPRREFELALRDEKEVLAEVRKRLQELSVTASAELTDLLRRRAHLEIALDKCRLGSGDCGAETAEMADVEASFRKKAGLSTREFRSGRRAALEHDAKKATGKGSVGLITANSYGDSCTISG